MLNRIKKSANEIRFIRQIKEIIKHMILSVGIKYSLRGPLF